MRPAARAFLLLVALGVTLHPHEAPALTFTVDSTADTSDANPGDCACADVNGDCTLGAAMEELTEIGFSPDACPLLPDRNEATVMLNVTGTILGGFGIFQGGYGFYSYAIIGPGSDRLTISGGGFGFSGFGSLSVELSGVTVTNAPVGVSLTAIPPIGSTYVELTDVALVGNGVGAKVDWFASLVLQDSKVANNIGDGIVTGAESVVIGYLGLYNTEVTGNGANGINCGSIGCLVGNSLLANNGGCGVWGGWGGGAGGSISVANSRITGNLACGLEGVTDRLAIDGTMIDGNGGGGVFSFRWYGQHIASIVGSTISGNEGPGLYLGTDAAPSFVVNTTISGNVSPVGGAGITVIGSGGLVVASTTITENVADSDVSGDGDGGGILASTDVGGVPTVELRDTILAGNLDLSGEAPECSGSFVSAGYNLLGDTTGCIVTGDLTGNVTSVDPKLAPLQNNGGPTDTHALLVGSPALDAGDPAGCTDQDGVLLTTDQRGAPRVQGATCDIGAYESGCGNSVVDLGEECDDGNRLDGDCCSSMCLIEKDGSPCSSGSVCMLAATCQGGTCVGETPVVIPPDGGTFTGTTGGGSTLAGTCGQSSLSPERVFQWTPPRSGVATIQTCSAALTKYDTVLYVKRDSCIAGPEIGCNDDTTGCGTTADPTNPHLGSRLRPNVLAGRPYFIVVDGYAGRQGAFALSVTPPPTTTTSTTSTTSTFTTSTSSTSSTSTSSTTTPTPPTTTTTVPTGTCAAPVILPAAGGTFTGTTSGASGVSGCVAQTSSAPERVYQWTPSASGTATLETCGAGTAFDTVLYVRSGTCAGGQVACNDDTTGCGTGDGCATANHHGSRVALTVTAGQPYTIIVDGYSGSCGGSSGAFTLKVTPPAGGATTTSTTSTSSSTSSIPPATTSSTTVPAGSTTTTTLPAGTCVAPIVIPPAGGTLTGTTSGTSALSGCVGPTASAPERVYSWTPSTSGIATIQTCGTQTTFDTVVYVRSTCASGTPLACNDDTATCGTGDGCASADHHGSRFGVSVTAGQTYYVIVDGYAGSCGGSSGTFRLTISPP